MACSNFPDCRNTKPIVKEIGVTCPKCDKGQIIERRSNKRNVFSMGAVRIQSVTLSWDKPIGRKCPKCEGMLVEKKLKKAYKYNVFRVIMKKNNKCERNCSHFSEERKGDKYMTTQVVNVIGAGLAGSEAAYQIAKRGVQVRLYEMRPVRQTPAHHTDKFAELVCSNSLRANTLTNAVGVIKEEMRLMDSVIIRAADECSVPAGGALAVDRHEFAAKVTEYVKNHPNVTVVNEEITEIPEGPTVIATGPLTSPDLSAQLKN